MTSKHQETVAQRIRTLAMKSNQAWAEEIAEAENEQRQLNIDPPVLVALERTLKLMVNLIHGEDVSLAMVSTPSEGAAGKELLVLTQSFILRAGIKGYTEDDSVVTVLSRSGLRQLKVTSRYEDRSLGEPDHHPEAVAVEAVYEGGEHIHYEEGQEEYLPIEQLLGELTGDLKK